MAAAMPTPTVRQARPQDSGAPDLLYLSAAAHYDRFAGSRERALRILRALYGQAGHSASYVDALAVHAAARRRGVASALLDAAGARALEEGCRFLALDTDLENAAARATYERMGMTAGELHRASAGQRRAVAATGFVGYAKRLRAPVG
jgi:ribosomal protein S18 acetylase RimI-like enzyme